MSRLGDKLRALRESRGFTQAQMADAIGHSKPSSVSGWETGGKRISLKNLLKYARFFDVKPAVIDVDGEVWNPEAPRNKTVRKVTVDALESRPHAMADQEAPDTKDGAMGGDNRTLLLDQLTATAKRLPLKALQAVVDLALEKDLARRRQVPAPAKNIRA